MIFPSMRRSTLLNLSRSSCVTIQTTASTNRSSQAVGGTAFLCRHHWISTAAAPAAVTPCRKIPSSPWTPRRLISSNANDIKPTTASRSMSTSSTPSAAAADDGNMKDEYGSMDDSGHSFVVDNYTLENGDTLPTAQLRYQTYGTLNAARDNVLVVCHALTGNASLHAWWGDLLGPQKAFDTSKYFVVCCNILGSCYGSTNPQSPKPPQYGGEDSSLLYGDDFPDVSVQDTVRLQIRLLQEHLHVSSVAAVIGGSFGGMQVVEYMVQTCCHHTTATDSSPFVRSAIPIACGAQHTAWQIGISEVQRQAIRKGLPGTSGLEIARQMGMISYRTAAGYETKFGRSMQNSHNNKKKKNDTTKVDSKPYGKHANWKVKSYLEYQGQKFLDRFDPITYIKLTEQMDSHDITRNRGTDSVADVLAQVTIPVLVLGIDSDILYPLSEQQQLADGLPKGELKIIHSPDGHDGFLLEQEQVGSYITEFLRQQAEREEQQEEGQQEQEG